MSITSLEFVLALITLKKLRFGPADFLRLKPHSNTSKSDNSDTG